MTSLTYRWIQVCPQFAISLSLWINKHTVNDETEYVYCVRLDVFTFCACGIFPEYQSNDVADRS